MKVDRVFNNKETKKLQEIIQSTNTIAGKNILDNNVGKFGEVRVINNTLDNSMLTLIQHSRIGKEYVIGEIYVSNGELYIRFTL